jgi:hypothetical protein
VIGRARTVVGNSGNDSSDGGANFDSGANGHAGDVPEQPGNMSRAIVADPLQQQNTNINVH